MIKLGTPVYAGTARFEGHVTGIFETTISVYVVQLGAVRLFHPDKVVSRKRPPLFAIGDEVNIVVDGTACRGVVTRTMPLFATVTDWNPVWQGCEVSGREAVIAKREEAA